MTEKLATVPGPTSTGELSQGEKPGTWVQIPHPDLMFSSQKGKLLPMQHWLLC